MPTERALECARSPVPCRHLFETIPHDKGPDVLRFRCHNCELTLDCVLQGQGLHTLRAAIALVAEGKLPASVIGQCLKNRKTKGEKRAE